MSEERLARVAEIRQQIAETEDRDELYRLRQALKFEKDDALKEQKAQKPRRAQQKRGASAVKDEVRSRYN